MCVCVCVKCFYKKYGHETSSEALWLSCIQNDTKILNLAKLIGIHHENHSNGAHGGT